MIRGRRLRDLREKAHMSQADLAEILQVGLAAINRYEREKTDPGSAVINKIADVFGVSTDFLLGRTDDPLPPYMRELSTDEIAIIASLRRGDKLKAIEIAIRYTPEQAVGTA